MKIVIALFFTVMTMLMLEGCDQLKEPYKTPALYMYQVLPQSTSDSIRISTLHHYAFVDTRISQSGKLLVFLGSTGSSPQNYASVSKVATSLGYYVINLSYLNSIDGQTCASESDPDCFANYHEEMIFGGSQSTLVEVNKQNAIQNRILKLLQRLHKQNPSNGWDQFYEGSELLYSKMALAGHGQGGGHAAYLAQRFAVDRLVMLSSPNDFSNTTGQAASWCQKSFATSADRFYGLTHKRDEVTSIDRQYSIWQDIGLLNETDTVSADVPGFSYYTAMVTHLEPNPTAKTQPLYRNLTAQEYALPAGLDRAQLKLVWLYMFGVDNH